MTTNERPRVVLVNRCFVRDNGKLLIIQRAPTDAMNAEKWEVPGGKLDEGQDLTHAQEREVLEETGLLVQPTHPFVLHDSFVIGEGRKYAGFPYVILFSITRVVGGTLALSEEHIAHEWVTYDEMLSYDLTVEVKKAAIMLQDYLQAPATSRR